MKRLITYANKTMLFFTVIAILASTSLSYSQDITMVQKGFMVKYDSTVLIDIVTYREIRNKSLYADTLIIGLRQELKEFNTQIDYYKVRQEATNQSNTILISQNKELRKANADIMGKYQNAIKPKWYKRPELYGIAGLVVGVLITR